MGAQRTSFAKLQRDRAKKANAAAKRERRQTKQDSTEETPAPPPPASGELSAAELLEQIEHVHRQFQAKQIDQEQYDEKKAELLARLPID